MYYSPLTLALFFALLIGISYASYAYFERPAQRYLRSHWLTAQLQQTRHNAGRTLTLTGFKGTGSARSPTRRAVWPTYDAQSCCACGMMAITSK